MIVLSRNGQEIGWVDFSLDDEVNGTGRIVRSIRDADFATRLDVHLRENPTRIRIIGGQLPDDLSRYPEGVRQAVAATVAESPGVTSSGRLGVVWTPPPDVVF